MAEVTPTEIEPFLWQLWEAKGTDLLFTVDLPPMLRVDGVMRPLRAPHRCRPTTRSGS